MTDRINSLDVVLERDIREDDISDLQRAIGMMRGVAEVGLNVASPGDYVAESRVRIEWTRMLGRLCRLSGDPAKPDKVQRLLAELTEI